MSKITVILTAANMGDVEETDFDIWTKFVSENIEARMGFEIATVSQHAFRGGPARDTVRGGTEEQIEAIRSWLSVAGWDEFCGQGGPWEKMRADFDATPAD